MRRRWEETIGACPALITPTKEDKAERTQYPGMIMPDANDTTQVLRSKNARYTFGFSGTEGADGRFSA